MDFESVFDKLARFSNKNRCMIMIFMITTTVLLSLGLLNLRLETDPQSLWVSHDSQGYKEEMFFNDNFGAFFRTEQIMMTQTDDGKRDLLDKKYLYALYFIEKLINTKSHEEEGKNITIDNLCYKPINAKGCYHPSPLDMWQLNITDVAIDEDIKYTNLCIHSRDPKSRIPCSDINGIPVLKQSIFGGISCMEDYKPVNNQTIPCTPCFIQAKALSLTYLLNNDEYTRESAEKWEKYVLQDIILKYNANNGSFIDECRKYFNVLSDGKVDIGNQNISIIVNLNDLTGDALSVKLQYMAQRSIPDELVNETSQNFWIVVFSYTLMFLYVGVAIGRFPSWKDSGFMLAILGIIIVGCSVFCSMGIIAYLGIGFTMISAEVIPFLILAIGVDNMFIIKNAVENQRILNERVSLENRLANGLREVGPSITTAAICQTLAFLVGSLTKMPALQSFCLQAALAVLFDYIFQITAFIVFLAWDEERREGKRMDLLCCIKVKASADKERQGFWKRFFSLWYANQLKKPACFGAILVVFLGLLAASILGLFFIPVGLNEQVSMETNSDLFNYFTYEKKYIEIGPPAYIILENFNYSNPDHIEIIDEMSNGLSRLEMVQPPVYSWIGVFNHFRNPKEAWNVACNTQDIDRYPIQQQLRKFMAVQIGSACCQTYGICGQQFNKDISFNDDGTIKSSRLRFMHTPLRSSEDYIKAAQSARQIVQKITLNFTKHYPQTKAFPYSLFYIYYDQYTYIRSIAVENLLLALAVVFVAVVMIQNLRLALIITAIVLITTFNLVGMVYLDNLLFKDHGFIIEINAISVVNIITCVGLAVEFTAHIAIAFLKEPGNRDRKLMQSLKETGSSVFIGIGLTKFVGVIVLAFAKSTLFRLYYFRMYLGIVLMGIFHGLILLPSLLYWMTPDNSAKFLDYTIDESDDKIE